MKKTIIAVAAGLSIAYSAMSFGGQASAQTITSSTNQAAANVINAGEKYLGTPYEYGSSRSDTKTFDCSDFTRQAFLDGAGIKLPGSSRSQANYVKKVGKTTTNWRNLKPGDLMFFTDYKGTKQSAYANMNKSTQRISHVGIYIGNGKVLHTFSNKYGGVTISNIAGTHWEYRFIFGGSAI